MNCIDPSVIDEPDALSVDPALDPSSAASGFSATGSNYTPDFVARYRQAQKERVARIEQPTFLIEYTGDPATFPADNDALFGWIGASHKSRAAFRDDHHGRVIHEGDEDPRHAVGRAIGECLRDWLARQSQIGEVR
jgi:hypothetical protein